MVSRGLCIGAGVSLLMCVGAQAQAPEGPTVGSPMLRAHPRAADVEQAIHENAGPPVQAAETECDRIAAFHLPHSSTADVHETSEPDWHHAVAVCQAEVAAHPGEMEFVYDLGRAQEHLKNYTEALRDFKAAADAGHVDATVELGSLFYFGHGVLQSYPTAFDDYSKAAAAGSVRALANLASMYGNGQGVPKNPVKALDLAERAIEAGNAFGLQIVALQYFNGEGVPRDYKMAAQYLQQYADLGDGRAMKFLANMYEGGYLGAPDPGRASELRLRAERVDPGSPDPVPAHLPMLRQALAPVVSHPRRYVVFRSNPVVTGGNAFSPLPTGATCCPNYMLVCSPPLRFCPR